METSGDGHTGNLRHLLHAAGPAGGRWVAEMNRRGFLFAGAAFAIVRPEILMPVRALALEPAPLPPGTYSVTVDDVQLTLHRLTLKWRLNGSYGKFGQPLTLTQVTDIYKELKHANTTG